MVLKKELNSGSSANQVQSDFLYALRMHISEEDQEYFGAQDQATAEEIIRIVGESY